MADMNVTDISVGAGAGAFVTWFVRRLMGDDVREALRNLGERMARSETTIDSMQKQLDRIEARLLAAERE